ncbi:hypothetical protein [Psychrobacter okhotskensis]|uniref:hypothetical protein n=1 Tax=Psychrobacter okhotskensis TaxID=212403 RepID=UPI003D04A00F
MKEKVSGSTKLNHLNPFWLHYFSLEKSLIEISDYVAITQSNFHTYSLKNMQLYFAICVETESVFEQIYKFINKGKSKSSSISRNMDMLFDHFPEVRNTAVTLNITGESLLFKPFENMFYNHEIEIEEKSKKTGEVKMDEDVQSMKNRERLSSWWREYNGVKHQRYEKFNQANLGNLLEAFAALHVLNILLPLNVNMEAIADYDSTFIIVPVELQPPMFRTVNYSLEMMSDGIRCYIGHISNKSFN